MNSTTQPKTILFYIGLPASGKTTDAKQRLQELDKNNISAIRVNKDDIREKWREEGKKFNERDVINYEVVLVVEAIRRGVSIIMIDNTHFNPHHKERYTKIATNYGYAFEVIDFSDVPPEECIRRDKLREKSVGEAVIWQMYYDHIHQVKKYSHTPGLPSAVICDLDGTLAEITDRSPYEDGKCYQDKVRPAVNLALNAMYSHVEKIIFVSGRKDSCRSETIRWLTEKARWSIGKDKESNWLLMRSADDNRKDAIVKRELFEKHIRGKYNVVFVLDDRDQVVKMWRDLGLDCFQVAPGNF